jgi:tryptophan synthase alpha chain
MTTTPSTVESAITLRRKQGGGALIGYLPVGFPTLSASIDAAVALVAGGVDILELGLPYSDPVMDGPVIQAATQQALAGGFRLRHGIEAVAAVTAQVDAPVLVMTYWNPILQYGVDRFADDLRAAGGAGLITPDLIPDDAADWLAASDRNGLDRVFLAAPSSSDARCKRVVVSCTRSPPWASRAPVATSTRPHGSSSIACAWSAPRAPASASASPHPARCGKSSATPTVPSSARHWCTRWPTGESPPWQPSPATSRLGPRESAPLLSKIC